MPDTREYPTDQIVATVPAVLRVPVATAAQALYGGALDTVLYRTNTASLAANGGLGQFGKVPPTAQPAAIASPTSDTMGTKAAIDAIRAVLGENR